MSSSSSSNGSSSSSSNINININISGFNNCGMNIISSSPASIGTSKRNNTNSSANNLTETYYLFGLSAALIRCVLVSV